MDFKEKAGEKRSTFNAQRSTFKEGSGERRFFGKMELVDRVEEAKRAYDLEERLLEYAARVIRLCEDLSNSRAGNHIAGQFLRCGTSPLANHGEAQGAESRRDFIHKLSVCLKEVKECRRWLRLIQRVPLVTPPSKVEDLLQETEELICIFVSSVRTAKATLDTEDRPG